MVMLFVFMFYVLVKKNLSGIVDCLVISKVLRIKLKVKLIGVLLGFMVIIGSLSGSDTIPTCVLREVFDVF